MDIGDSGNPRSKHWPHPFEGWPIGDPKSDAGNDGDVASAGRSTPKKWRSIFRCPSFSSYTESGKTRSEKAAGMVSLNLYFFAYFSSLVQCERFGAGVVAPGSL